MKKIVFILLVSILVTSCSKSDDVSGNFETAYIVHPNSTLQINATENGDYPRIENGNNLVFEYRYSTQGSPEIADDEFTEVVFFELDSSTENFTLNPNNFDAAKTYIGKFCYCGNTGYFKVTSGEINGEKSGDQKWNVNLDISADVMNEFSPQTTIEVQASGQFKPEN